MKWKIHALFSKSRAERALFYKKKKKSLRGILICIYISFVWVHLEVKGWVSCLYPRHGCAVGAIGNPPDPLTKPVYPSSSCWELLCSHLTDALGQLRATPTHFRWLHSPLALFSCSIPLFSFSCDLSPNSGASWWKFRAFTEVTSTRIHFSRGIWPWKNFKESVFRSLNSIGPHSYNSFLENLPEFIAVLFSIGRPHAGP